MSSSVYAPFVGANAVSVTILDRAPELWGRPRFIAEASSMDPLNLQLKLLLQSISSIRLARLNQFLIGESAPSIEWADFDADIVRGAYLTGKIESY